MSDKNEKPTTIYGDLLDYLDNLYRMPPNDDRQKKRRYICLRIPLECTTRIYLNDGGEDGPPDYADLSPSYDEYTDYWELLIETNNPGWVDLNTVYDFFRHEDMTSDERRQEIKLISLARHARNHVRDYEEKLSRLSPTERDLFDAASETVPLRGAALIRNTRVPHYDDGHSRGCLSNLVKLGLLMKVHGGYVRVPTPRA